MRWVTRIFGFLVLLVVVAIGTLFLLPTDRIARIAAEQIRVATGRDVAITGDVSLSVWPVLGASIDGLEVGNAEWSKQGPMLSAQNASLGVDAAALLRGEIRITNIAAQSPTIRLESRKDGRASWQFTDASGAAQIETSTDPDTAPQALSIAELRVTDATLVYDAEGSDLISYSGVDLALDWPDPNGEATISGTLRPAGVPVRMDAVIDAFSSFLGGDVRPVDVRLSTAKGSVALKGRAGISGEVAGAVSLDLAETDGFLRALGLPGAELPVGLGRSMKVSGDVTLTAARMLSLRGLRADLGGNTLSGAADVSLNGTPQVNAQLSAGALDLSTVMGGESSTESAAGWSKAAIDASGLAAFNGEIALIADSIDLGALKFGKTRTLLRNDRSRAVFELREVAAYNGTLNGEFVVNNRNGLSVGGQMTGSGLQLKGLLGDALGLSRLSGAAQARLKFLGVGGSVDAIMRSLSGDGSLSVGRGQIEGLDLNALMRAGKGSGGTTVFDSLGATFAIQAGVLSNSDLLMKLPDFEAKGAGTVGLGAQVIDYTITPTALRANSGKGVSIPVRIRGPWADPSIVPDLGAAVELNFGEEKKKIEAEVKQKVQARVEKELGVTTEPGESIGDALEKKLEEEVGNRLRKLFD